MHLLILGVLFQKRTYLLLNSNNLFYSSLLRKNNMQKNYSEKKFFNSSLQPKSETINFLINYSKSLSIIELNSKKLEINLN
jgi:hypothetical protein